MEPVHERCIVSHVRRKRPEEVPDALCLIEIHIEIADEHNPTFGPD
jgi:hypothetical protein